MQDNGEITIDAESKLTITVGSSSFEMDKEGNISINGVKINIENKEGAPASEITLNAENTKVIGITQTEVGKKGGEPGMIVNTNTIINGEDVDIN